MVGHYGKGIGGYWIDKVVSIRGFNSMWKSDYIVSNTGHSGDQIGECRIREKEK